MYWAVTLNRYQEVETSYARNFLKTIYYHKDAYWGYGIKTHLTLEIIKQKAPEVVNLEGLLLK